MSDQEQIKPYGVKEELKYKNVSEQMRVVRGYAIISKGDTPKQIDKSTFEIPSQNGNGFYTVTNKDKWKCTCLDFEKRKKSCKHIHAIKFFLELKNKVRIENRGQVSNRQNCPYCNSKDTVGFGKRKCKDRVKQKYRCNDCRRYFIEEKDFQRYKGNGKITTMILDLYFKGISLRGIKDHLKQFYDLSLDHSNILRRIQKFSKIIDDYVKTLKPELSEIWHTDEMQIQAGGKWRWLWSVMDSESKFLISKMVSDRRRIRDSRKLFGNSRDVAQKQPEIIITDGCHSYNRSLAKEMPKTNHVQLKTIRDHINNNPIERLNGSIRDRLKVMRGMQNSTTANLMTSAFQNYYNFIRLHSTVGTTPAEASGLNVIGLEGNRWLNLLEKSVKNGRK